MLLALGAGAGPGADGRLPELLEQAGFSVLGASGPDDLLDLIGREGPDVLLYDIDDPELGGWEGMSRARLAWPGPVIVVSGRGDEADLEEAVRRGAQEYLTRPLDTESLLAALSAVNRQAEPVAAAGGRDGQARTAAQASSGPAPAGSAPGPPGPREGEPPPGRQATVIAVFSTKGGVGKTTLASNLAVALFQATGEEVVLVDLDLEFGSLATYFGLRPPATIVDLCRLAEPITPEVVHKALVAAQPPGVRLLAAPASPDLAAEVEGEGRKQPDRNYVEEILTALAAHNRFVVVDTGCNFREAVLTTLDLAERVLLVSTPDIPALQNTGKALDVLLKRLEYPAAKVNLVLNRADKLLGLTEDDIRQGLEFQIAFKLPTDEATAVWAANYGRPFMLDRPGSRLGRAVTQVARALVKAGTPARAGGPPRGGSKAARDASWRWTDGGFMDTLPSPRV